MHIISTSLVDLKLFRLKEYFIIRVKYPIRGFRSALLIMVWPIDSFLYQYIKDMDLFLFNIYHIYVCLLTYFINISITSSFIPDVVLLELCTIVNRVVANYNDTLRHLHWFWNVFTGAVVDLGRCSSYNTDYPFETGFPGCSIHTMDTMVSLVLMN